VRSGDEGRCVWVHLNGSHSLSADIHIYFTAASRTLSVRFYSKAFARDLWTHPCKLHVLTVLHVVYLLPTFAVRRVTIEHNSYNEPNDSDEKASRCEGIPQGMCVDCPVDGECCAAKDRQSRSGDY
jgi:hypothetical protein